MSVTESAAETICRACGSPLYRRPKDTWLVEHGGRPYFCVNPECSEAPAIPVQTSMPFPLLPLVAAVVVIFACVGFIHTLHWLARGLFGHG